MLLCKNGAFSNVTPDMFLELLQGLGKESIISQTHTGQIVIGEIGEKIVKDIDFYAAFTASPDVLVIEKKSGKHIGTINEDLNEGSIFILSGRYWLVLERDNSGTRLFVEQTRAQGDYHFSSPILDIDRIIVEKMREVSVGSGVQGADYVRVKYEVNKAKLAADIKAGVLGKADLTKLNISLEPTVNFKVDRVKTEKELYDLKAAAIELAESVE
jgi:hypothetical protein